MDRRDFLHLGGIGVAASVFTSTAVSASARDPIPSTYSTVSSLPESERPNVLWFCTDQQRGDTIHALGNSAIHTPNIDKLVETGVAFTNAYSQSAICTPSRASFLTGKYPSTVHQTKNGAEYWPEASPLISKIFAESGYDCALSGKLHLAGAWDGDEKVENHGYDRMWYCHAPHQGHGFGNDYTEWLQLNNVKLTDVFTSNPRGRLGRYRRDLNPEYHLTTWCTDKAVDVIHRKRAQPWFMSVNVFDPHPAFDPPQEYIDRYELSEIREPDFRDSDIPAQKKLEEADVMFQRSVKKPDMQKAKEEIRKYWAQIDLIDENIGRLLDALDDTGQREDTIFIFMSDHGTMLGDHGLWRKGCRFYEGLINVPLIISWPGTIQENVQSEALVELTDIVPTLMEASGLSIPEEIQGKSLMSLLTGESDPQTHREYVRAEYYQTLQGPQSYATMIRNDRYKLVNYHGTGLGELFDLQNDPHEFTNLWDDPEYADIKLDLIIKNFDATAFAIDTGPRRIGRY